MNTISSLNRTAVRLGFRARAAGILAVVCLAVGLGGPVGSASAAEWRVGGYDLNVVGSQWDVCTNRTHFSTLAHWTYAYGNKPALVVWTRSWYHETRNSAGQDMSAWSQPSGWANAESLPGPYLNWYPTYYPNEIAVEYRFVNKYNNQIVEDVTVREKVNQNYNDYSCTPVGGWRNWGWNV